MGITLTTDPIITEAIAREFVGTEDKELLKLMINSVSEKFKIFTNRSFINRVASAVTEYLYGNNTGRIFVSSPPINVSDGEITVEILQNGETLSTYTNTSDSNGDCIGYENDGLIYLESAIAPFSDTEKNVKVEYKGGFVTVPGNIVQGAIMQIHIERQRLDGLVGIENISREGESVSYEQTDLIRAVRDLWQPYKVLL